MSFSFAIVRISPGSLKIRNGVLGNTVKVITQQGAKQRSLKLYEGHKQINTQLIMTVLQFHSPHGTTGHKVISLLVIEKERGKEEA